MEGRAFRPGSSTHVQGSRIGNFVMFPLSDKAQAAYGAYQEMEGPHGAVVRPDAYAAAAWSLGRVEVGLQPKSSILSCNRYRYH